MAEVVIVGQTIVLNKVVSREFAARLKNKYPDIMVVDIDLNENSTTVCFKTNMSTLYLTEIKQDIQFCLDSNMYPLDGPIAAGGFESVKVGVKHDNGKLEWSLLPIKPIQWLIKVLMYGKAKYGANNWQMLDNFNNRYYDALQRHITAWKDGEECDKESGLPHLAHAFCNILFLTWKNCGAINDKAKI
jgi:hypothetical protein